MKRAVEFFPPWSLEGEADGGEGLGVGVEVGWASTVGRALEHPQMSNAVHEARIHRARWIFFRGRWAQSRADEIGAMRGGQEIWPAYRPSSGLLPDLPLKKFSSWCSRFSMCLVMR